MNERLSQLIEKFHDGELGAGESAELEELLRSDADARARFVEQCLMEAQLHKALAVTEAARPDQRHFDPALPAVMPFASPYAASSGRFSASRAALVVFIAASLLLMATVWFNWDAPVDNPGSPQPGLAQVRGVAGEIFSVDAAGRVKAVVGGRVVEPGEKFKTEEEEGFATLLLADATQVHVGPGGIVSFLPQNDGGFHIHLEQGAIQVEACQQPRERPLVFTTDHARVLVLGTKFRLYKEESASRVELEEGKVKFVRTVDGKEIEVHEGSGAVATAEPEPLAPAPLSHAVARIRYTLPKAGNRVAISPDGRWLASTKFGTLKLYRLADGGEVRAGGGHGDAHMGFAFSRDGSALVALSQNKALTLWDTSRWEKKTWPLFGNESTRDGAVSSDGRWAAVGQVERKMFLWSIDAATRSIEKKFDLRLKDNPNRVALSRELASGFPRLAYGHWVGAAEVVDLTPAGTTLLRNVRLTKSPVALALSDDGDALATYSLPDGLQLWDVKNAEKKDLWTSQATRIQSLRFSPDRSLLAAGLTDGTARVWSTLDGQSLLVLDAGSRVHSLAFSPDSALLAVAADSHHVTVWELKTN